MIQNLFEAASVGGFLYKFRLFSQAEEQMPQIQHSLSFLFRSSDPPCNMEMPLTPLSQQ